MAWKQQKLANSALYSHLKKFLALILDNVSVRKYGKHTYVLKTNLFSTAFLFCLLYFLVTKKILWSPLGVPEVDLDCFWSWEKNSISFYIEEMMIISTKLYSRVPI